MRTHRNPFVLGALAASLALNACARPPETVAAPSAVPHAHESTAAPAPAATAMPRILVHKSPSCGCCGSWVEHLRRSGFVVDVQNEEDIGPIKARVGVPYGKGSCHTAEIGGYFIEGHVPAEDIKRLLAERPAAKGLTLPGMPAGSPGMEMPDGRIDPYTVELVNPDGSTHPFSRHGKTGS
jgi:hypothetical protein